MDKDSPLTPFFANGIQKMAESGITNIHAKRHIISKPNCKPIRSKGRPLGMEKFASLFAFYSTCCIMSLIILVMENIFKPSCSLFHQHLSIKNESTDDQILKIKIEAILKQYKTLEDDTAKQIFLLNKVKSILEEGH